MQEKENKCSFCLSICATVILGFIMIWAAIIAIPSLVANKNTCYLGSVTYPKDNYTNPSDYVNCNCGRGCSESWGYCVKIQVKVDNINYIAYNDVSKPVYNSECTFSERKCLENKNQSFEKAKNISIPFIQKINETISCYEYDGNIYLTNSDKNKNIALMCVMIGLTTISVLIILLLTKCKPATVCE